MRSVAPLVSGVAGAGNGTCNLYKRGTATLATIYADYAGSVVTDNPVSLDANGGAVVYVNEEVDCAIVNSSGLALRNWTEMDSANNVEYIGKSFTGADYSSGAAGTGKPVALQTVLDGWLTSAGAPDFDVEVSGSAMSLQNAMATVAGIFYNVQAPAYGAIGDNTADDTVAIQAALSAAGVEHGNGGGGVVWFPPGNYRITSVLIVPRGVSIRCCAGTVIINVDHATSQAFLFGTTNSVNEVYGLTVQADQVNTGTVMVISGANGSTVILDTMTIGGTLNTGALVTKDSSTSVLRCKDVIFVLFGSAQQAIVQDATTTNPLMRINGCVFAQENSSYVQGSGVVECVASDICGCIFVSAATTTSGSAIFIRYGGTFSGTVEGCTFIAASATVFPEAMLLSLSAQPTGFSESANIFVGVGKKYSISGPDSPTSTQTFHLGSRIGAYYEVTDNGATSATLPVLQYEMITLKRTTNGNQTIAMDAAVTQGMTFTLIVHNKSGGASGTLTPGSVCRTTATFSIATDVRYEVINYISKANNIGVIEWVERAARQNNI